MIKLFPHKHPSTTLYVIGKQKDLIILEKNKNIVLSYIFIEGQNDIDLVEANKKASINVLNKEEGDCLISFLPKKEVYVYTSKSIKKIYTPFYLTSFLTGSNNRYAFLADSGLNDELSLTSLWMYIKIVFHLLKSFLNIFTSIYFYK